MTEVLKSCPFCGGGAAHGLWGDRRMAVRCFRCDALGPTTDHVPEVCIEIRPFIDQAITAWNRRSPTPLPADGGEGGSAQSQPCGLGASPHSSGLDAEPAAAGDLHYALANLEHVTGKLETAEAALRSAGVCMSCWGGLLPTADPNGCTDCLNTGFAHGQPDLRWRPELVAFADLMERELRENDHKGGWASEHQRHLFDRMQEEADELALVIYARTPWSRAQNLKAPDPAQVGSEAADVANFAMMIADVCGALRASAASPSGVSDEVPGTTKTPALRQLGEGGSAVAESTGEGLRPFASETHNHSGKED